MSKRLTNPKSHLPRLPIEEALPDLMTALTGFKSAVLVAPPGAGKTTRVPLALLEEPWLRSGRIVILEPRRIAARSAAARMADTLGERIGQTVGLRARLQTAVGPATRIEVVTEGVFTRMILDDPELTDIKAVLFDEFHERSLDADFGLALALDCQSGLREDLRILVMSATLAGARVSRLMQGAPLIESLGRMHPVETRYLARDPARRLEDRMTDAILMALDRDEGSILAFLPGASEIRRVCERLLDRASDPGMLIAPLYGALPPEEQDRAISPAPPGIRKVVLATDIAESSLTISGVRIVIDSGLARVPRHEPGAGVTRLETIRASRASIDQRRGRAGRTEPGVCYRLWDEPQTTSLPEFAEPEIQAADLGGLVLDAAEWGVTDLTALRWLDPPPPPAIEAAREALAELSAIDPAGALTSTGRALRRLPLPPRLAAMVLNGAASGMRQALEAAEVAALLVERGLGGNDPDVSERLQNFRRDNGPRAKAMRRLAGNWAQQATQAARSSGACLDKDRLDTPAVHLATAFPSRIAKNRGDGGNFVLASGRGAKMPEEQPLARAPYLVVADLQGAAASTRILSAVELSETELQSVAGHRIAASDEVVFDRASRSVRARSVSRLGAIVLSSTPGSLKDADPEAIADALATGLAKIGIGELPWSKPQAQLRARTQFLRQSGDPRLPDLSDGALSATVTDWLAPFLAGKTKASEVSAADLALALDTLVEYGARRHLDAEAPTHFLAPTGERHPIDYEGPGAPALNIRVQELFGLKQHPAIADGRLPLTLNLLSPARRPIQVTRDLPGFWAGSWADVRSEMKGRYPKHPWPDDPANAEPTRRAKPRGT